MRGGWQKHHRLRNGVIRMRNRVKLLIQFINTGGDVNTAPVCEVIVDTLWESDCGLSPWYVDRNTAGSTLQHAQAVGDSVTCN